ncbi:c-type cytochrome [Aneurinibacillus terranovensis]|uniref:c-type cytochrome n=1 Tax=Aneurinibacillus terranovensis TaxID=278991 RepID=UPI000483DC1B|nr:c-type cytochrome [Aneurinibacillus terranovensis]
MRKRRGFVLLPMMLGASLMFAGCSSAPTAGTPSTGGDNAAQAKQEVNKNGGGNQVAFNPPKLDSVPKDQLGQSIMLGYKIISETPTAVPNNVGNKLACISCHADGGLKQTELPLVGIPAVMPMYRDREGRVITMEDRINECFKRSENGKPLASGSKELTAVVSYLSYISEGVPMGANMPWRGQGKADMSGIKPDKANGEKLYKQACMACHGADGAGLGPTAGPALWGPNSFNVGAGMSRISTATPFIQKNMPKSEMGGIKPGSLTKQQAADLAAYIVSQKRPDFSGKKADWPKGKKPKDALY